MAKKLSKAEKAIKKIDRILRRENIFKSKSKSMSPDLWEEINDILVEAKKP